jgi:hypothetical protein
MTPTTPQTVAEQAATSNGDPAATPAHPEGSPQEESRYHTYRTHRVPWFVHALWLCFWALAIYYVLRYQFPVLPLEIRNPP